MNKIEYITPSKCITNEELSKIFPNWDYQTFESKVGIKQRYITTPDETALDLAFEASSKCLENEDKAEIDYVILCTQSPDYFLPTSACILQNRLNLSTNCGALDFSLGCSGYIYGLSLVKGLLSAGIAKKILFVTAETYSKHIHPQDRTNRSIFGDAASATLIAKEDLKDIGEFVLRTDGAGFENLIVKNGAMKHIKEINPDLISYGTENYTSDNHLYMNGPEIFSFTIDVVPKLIKDTLEKNNIEKDDVDFYVFHQANQFMLNFLRKKCKIPQEKFIIDMEDTGNTVSSTIPIVLRKSFDKKIINIGDKVLLAGFGVGLSYGATIITI